MHPRAVIWKIPCQVFESRLSGKTSPVSCLFLLFKLLHLYGSVLLGYGALEVYSQLSLVLVLSRWKMELITFTYDLKRVMFFKARKHITFLLINRKILPTIKWLQGNKKKDPSGVSFNFYYFMNNIWIWRFSLLLRLHVMLLFLLSLYPACRD